MNTRRAEEMLAVVIRLQLEAKRYGWAWADELEEAVYSGCEQIDWLMQSEAGIHIEEPVLVLPRRIPEHLADELEVSHETLQRLGRTQ